MTGFGMRIMCERVTGRLTSDKCKQGFFWLVRLPGLLFGICIGQLCSLGSSVRVLGFVFDGEVRV